MDQSRAFLSYVNDKQTNRHTNITDCNIVSDATPGLGNESVLTKAAVSLHV